MTRLYYCPRCHKVFYWRFNVMRDTYCPNCYDGYVFHKLGGEEESPPASYLHDIVLKEVED